MQKIENTNIYRGSPFIEWVLEGFAIFSRITSGIIPKNVI